MSADSQEDRQGYEDSGSAEIDRSTETEISDETLEAVAGGVTAKAPSENPPIDEDSWDSPIDEG